MQGVQKRVPVERGRRPPQGRVPRPAASQAGRADAVADLRIDPHAQSPRLAHAEARQRREQQGLVPMKSVTMV